MTEHKCRQEEDIKKLQSESTPVWVRAVFITICLVVAAGIWNTYSTLAATYATKVELKEQKVDLTKKIDDLKTDIVARLVRIEDKLDNLDKPK